MRLIDADALDWECIEHKYGARDDAVVDCEIMIDTAPTVDAVPVVRYKSMENTCVKLQKSLADVAPVVRCKDCRHAVDYYHEGDCYCSNPKWGLNYFGGSWEFYCADAERRNNE